MKKKKQTYCVTPESPGSKRILAALVGHDLSIPELSQRAFLSINAVRNQYARVLLTNGLIHRSGWKRSSRGPASPIYRLGPGENAPPLLPLDADIEHKRRRCREWKVRSGYNEAQKAEQRLRRPPDHALAALLGIQL